MKKTLFLTIIPILSYAYMGLGAEMDVYVEACQTPPLAGATVIILGEQVAIEDGDEGYYRFEWPVYPGDYTLYAYTDFSDIYREDFRIAEGMEDVHWHIALCLCVDNQLSLLTGKVLDEKGKAISGAAVSIGDLFLTATTDKSGKYSLDVPPGGWTVSVNAPGYKSSEKQLVFTGPEEPGMEINKVKYDFKLSK